MKPCAASFVITLLLPVAPLPRLWTSAAAGVALTLAASPLVVPTTARSSNVYFVPLVRLLTVCVTVVSSLPEMSVQADQVLPPSVLWRIWYPVIVESEGSVQLSTTWPTPPCAVRPVGAAETPTARVLLVTSWFWKVANSLPNRSFSRAVAAVLMYLTFTDCAAVTAGTVSVACLPLILTFVAVCTAPPSTCMLKAAAVTMPSASSRSKVRTSVSPSISAVLRAGVTPVRLVTASWETLAISFPSMSFSLLPVVGTV